MDDVRERRLMGARLVVKFGNEEIPPRVYLHWGGEYVDDVKQTMDGFMSAAQMVRDSRLNDPSYLAARFLVWAVHEQGAKNNPLDFLSVGIVTADDWGDAVVTVPCEGTATYTIDSALDM
jgi:hypothetical protein